MSDIRYITNSELKTFRRCKRQWWLGNYRGLQLARESVTGAASLGSRVHRALELVYSSDVESAIADFHATVEADVARCPEQEKDIRADADMALAMIEGYLEWASEEGEDEDYELIEPESTLEVDLPGFPGVRLIGKLDQRVRRISTGERLFRDFKTVQDFSRVGLLHLDTQMKHYHLLERLHDPDARTGGALYTMIRRVKRTAKAKPPFFMNVPVRHNEIDLSNYFKQVVQEVSEILALEQHIAAGHDPVTTAYPNPTRDCSWDCDFLPVCGLFNDGSDAEGLVSSLYVAGDHLSRYSDTLMNGDKQ